MKHALLLLLLIFPCRFIGMDNPQLAKAGIIGLLSGVVFAQGWPRVSFAGLLGVMGGVVVLWLLFCVSLGSPYVSTHTLWFIGNWGRVEGWAVMFCTFTVGALWWSKMDVSEGMVTLVGVLVVFVVFVVVTLVGWGWVWLLPTVGTKYGVAALLCVVVPVLFVALLDAPMRGKGLWRVLGAIVCAFIIIPLSGCRAACVAMVAGMVVASVMACRGGKDWPFFWIFGIAVAMVCLFAVPGVRERIHLPTFQGARADIARQVFHHGLTFFGQGLESQIGLLNQWEIRNGEVARYDKMHCWPVDVLACGGVVGLALILLILWFVGRVAWRNRGEWHVRACAGGLTAFLVFALWNPPTPQVWVLAAICAFGILSSEPEEHPIFALPCIMGLCVGSFLCAVFIWKMCVGDMMNHHAQRALERGSAPHNVIGLQEMAVRFNPWLRGPMMLNVHNLAQTRRLIELEAMRPMFMRELKADDPMYEMRAYWWLYGAGNEGRSRQAMALAEWERSGR